MQHYYDPTGQNMEDDLNSSINGRQPNFFQMEKDLILLEMKDDFNLFSN